MLSNQLCRILVVDDFAHNLFLLQTALEEEGYEVETATNGSSALAKIEAKPPDLVLLDVMMPGMNGYEVTRRIRENINLPLIPILLVSACEQTSAEEGLKLGANDFIRKPINLDKLLTTIEEFCRPKVNQQ